jgi:membrane-bound metal-dependent hydrolase YbcI (DUF457 family)
VTPVGHSLTGLAIGLVVCPKNFSVRERIATLSAFVLLANAPDLPFPNWGHTRYDISHSLLVTTAAIIVAIALLVALPQTRRIATPRLLLGGALAWYSHLLLDTFYAHGKGLPMFWPVSGARIALPIPLFATMKLSPLLSRHNFEVFAIEAAAYGAVLVLAIAINRRLANR